MGLAHVTGSTPSWLTYIEKYGHVPGPELRERIAAALNVVEDELWPEGVVDFASVAGDQAAGDRPCAA